MNADPDRVDYRVEFAFGVVLGVVAGVATLAILEAILIFIIVFLCIGLTHMDDFYILMLFGLFFLAGTPFSVVATLVGVFVYDWVTTYLRTTR